MYKQIFKELYEEIVMPIITVGDLKTNCYIKEQKETSDRTFQQQNKFDLKKACKTLHLTI